MIRAFFFAIGVFTALVGGELLLLDRAVLNLDQRSPVTRSLWSRGRYPTAQKRVFAPPDWAGWSLLSAGAVTTLYSLAIPRKKRSSS